MITLEREKYHWDFLFLGSEIDAEKVAGSMGIPEERSVKARRSADNVKLQYESISMAIGELRCASAEAPRTGKWREKLLKDLDGKD